MTDAESQVDQLRYEESLVAGRERLGHMRRLADFMVYAFGVSQDNSRTMMWQEGDTTYFLGRGGHWEDLTGAEQTDENWLYVLPGEEASAGEAHLISHDNSVLAGNEERREEVAQMIQRGVVQRLLTTFDELFPPRDGQPGAGALAYQSRNYNFQTFTDAATPFVFIKSSGDKFEISPDGIFRPLDEHAPVGKHSPFTGSVEEQLHLLSRVLIEGTDITATPQHTHTEGAYASTVDVPHTLDDMECEMAHSVIQEISAYYEQPPENMEVRRVGELTVIRTLLPRMGYVPPMVTGMVVGPHTWLMETLAAYPDAVIRQVTELNSETGQVFGARTVIKDMGETTTAQHGATATLIAENAMEDLRYCVTQRELLPADPNLFQHFRHHLLQELPQNDVQ